jgi:hypothetical protein
MTDVVIDVESDAETDADLRLEFVEGSADPEILDCELEVQHQWYGDTAEEIEEAYGPWSESTVWLAVRATSGRVLGACRLITPGQLPQRTLAEASAPPWSLAGRRLALELGIDEARAWDVATINVRRELGSAGADVAAALYHGVFVAPDVNGGEWLLAMLDLRVRRLLASVGLFFHPLPGARPERYMGSPALQPVYAHLHRLVGQQERQRPDEYARITLGRGLGDIAVPEVDTFRLSRPVLIDLSEERTTAP